MTNEEINMALYEKMFAERDRYRDWLLSQPAEEILSHAREYTVREYIVASFQFVHYRLPDAEALALLKSPSPLADIYKELDNRETGLWDDVWKAVESHAKSVLQQAQEKAAKRKVPENVR